MYCFKSAFEAWNRDKAERLVNQLLVIQSKNEQNILLKWHLYMNIIYQLYFSGLLKVSNIRFELKLSKQSSEVGNWSRNSIQN